MARSNYIYTVRDENEQFPMACFTVKWEALAWCRLYFDRDGWGRLHFDRYPDGLSKSAYADTDITKDMRNILREG